jgi:gamma-glutamyltranspeptidase/glutathione hydrolase
MKQTVFAVLVLAASMLWPAAALTQQSADAAFPEAATGTSAKKIVRADRHMVVAANPLAAQAGLEVLRNGGTAADALVAVQTVLGLAEPQSSGLGGGAFLVWYDAATQSVTTFDGRETAPSAATPELFLDSEGMPLGFFEAVVGGRSVGTPGVPRLMQTIHGRYGSRPWPELFDTAIQLAEDGFAVSPRLNALITDDAERLASQAATRAYFLDASGAPLAVGTTLRNPEYAETLRAIAAGGADAFYTGEIAEAIVETVRSHADNPGLLSLQDLAGYVVKERDVVCAPYRGYEVCGMGPPSSGALAVGQILGIVSDFEIGRLGPEDPESWRIFGDASRLAFADRERFVADSDFVSIPKGLLNADYLASRAQLLRRPVALGQDEATAGAPPWDRAELRLDGMSFEAPSTSHFVIVDEAGNIASMTSSIESGFGSRLMAAGFLLNNQLTDFSFAPEKDGQAVANRVEPGKRPRSSMSPTIVLKNGTPVFALGSPGGSNIIPYVAKTVIALIDWRMDIQAAVSLAHLANRFGTYDIELGTDAEALAGDLEALGYSVNLRDLNSGLHGVAITAAGLEGGADPRREGLAVGD